MACSMTCGAELMNKSVPTPSQTSLIPNHRPGGLESSFAWAGNLNRNPWIGCTHDSRQFLQLSCHVLHVFSVRFKKVSIKLTFKGAGCRWHPESRFSVRVNRLSHSNLLSLLNCYRACAEKKPKEHWTFHRLATPNHYYLYRQCTHSNCHVNIS